MKCNTNNMRRKFYKVVKEQYSFWSTLTNAMIAFGVAGLTLLGVISPMLTTLALVVWGVLLSFTYFLGKFLDQQIEDMEKVERRTKDVKVDVERRCKHEQDS